MSSWLTILVTPAVVLATIGCSRDGLPPPGSMDLLRPQVDISVVASDLAQCTTPLGRGTAGRAPVDCPGQFPCAGASPYCCYNPPNLNVGTCAASPCKCTFSAGCNYNGDCPRAAPFCCLDDRNEIDCRAICKTSSCATDADCPPDKPKCVRTGPDNGDVCASK